MKKEELLKNISELLKKHEGYLNDNPEVFYAIEDRLFKAIDYEDWEGEEDPEEEEDYGEGYGDDLFDRVPDEDYERELENTEEELDEADQWLAQQEAAGGEERDHPDVDEDGTVQQEVQEEPAPEAKKRSGRYLDWKAQDKYEDHHQEAIDRHLEDGYSHREAERLAGAHEAPGDFYSALKHTTNPSEPSPKMLEQMKQLAHGWLRNADAKRDAAAEAERNPVRYASAKNIAAHDEVHGGFNEAYSAFINSDEVKGLKGRERHKAIKAWKANYHEENPDHREKAIAAADTGKITGEAMEARAKARKEGSQALLEAGMATGETTPMSTQEPAQMVGGEKGEGGYQTNIKKDPAAVFAERNPEYIKHLRGKLENKLSPEQSQRMAGVDSFKNKGDK